MKEKITKRLAGAHLCYSLSDDRNIEEQVRFAKEHGATHFNISHLPYEYDEFMPDNSDPYPNWSQGSIGLFRVFPPPELQKHIPAEIVQTNLKYLDKIVETIRKSGLRCTLEGKEPLWLPESAYREQPRWRGGQCELGRITTKPYFTPAIDDPEVLDLYTWAIKAWCSRYPEFDYFFFWTNDCGSGLPWSTYQYPGINGPSRHRLINPGTRMRKWFEALNKGTEKAGVSARLNIASFSFTPAELGAIRAELPEYAYFNSVNSKGESALAASASIAGTMDTPNCSVPGIIPPFSFVDDLRATLAPGTEGEFRKISIDSNHMELASELITAVVNDDSNSQKQWIERKAAILAQVADKLFSHDCSEAALDAWMSIEKAQIAISQIRQRGIAAGVALSMNTARWLYRPLVPKPLELTEEEKAHYKPYLFSCASKEMDANLCFILGKPIFIGDSVVWMTRWAINDAVGKIKSAVSTLNSVIAKCADDAAEKRLKLLTGRLKTLICVLENARLTIMYQHALDISINPRFGANHLDFDDNITFDQRALELRKIAREDLDNTMELIELLKDDEKCELFDRAKTKKDETVFIYGPDIVECLKRKMDIMLDHWQEYETLYPTSKVYEFEPGESLNRE